MVQGLLSGRRIDALGGLMNRPGKKLFAWLRTLAAPILAIAFSVGCSSSSNPAEPSDDGGASDGRTPVTNVTLDPPATLEDGWQYAIPAFSVDAGAEVQQCFFFKVPTDVAAFVNHIEIAQTSGTHHMNIFRMRTQK